MIKLFTSRFEGVLNMLDIHEDKELRGAFLLLAGPFTNLTELIAATGGLLQQM